MNKKTKKKVVKVKAWAAVHIKSGAVWATYQEENTAVQAVAGSVDAYWKAVPCTITYTI